MRYFFFLIFILSATQSVLCKPPVNNSKGTTRVVITVDIKAFIGNGKIWFQKQLLPKREFIDIDSAVVTKKGNFQFSFPTLTAGYYMIYYKNDRISLGRPILIDSENCDIKVMVDTMTLRTEAGEMLIGKAEVSGSKDNDLLDGYFERINRPYFQNFIFPLEQKIRIASTNNSDASVLDSLNILLKKHKEESNKKKKEYVLNNMGTSIAVFQTMGDWDNTDLSFMETVINKFRNQRSQSFILPLMEEKYEALVKTSLLNHKAPLFSLMNPSGQVVNLEDYIGKKTVLLDFWASWCGPCIKEMNGYKEAFKKIEMNDIVIISVSTDKTREAWLSGLARFQFPWVQLIDDPNAAAVAKKYGIRELPTNFLIDKDGVIKAKNVTLVDLLKK